MTRVEIVPAEDLWPSGDPLGRAGRLGEAWLVLDEDGRFSYQLAPGRAGALAARVPPVTAGYATVMLEQLTRQAQQVLDSPGDLAAEFAFRAAVSGFPVPDDARVVVVEAGQWIADQYGTRIGLVDQAGLTADTSDLKIDRIVAAEEVKATAGLRAGRVILAGLRSVLHGMRLDRRWDMFAAADADRVRMAEISDRQRANVRRFAAWGKDEGMTDRRIADVVGVRHPTVAAWKPSPAGMIQRIRLRVEAGDWTRGSLGVLHMHHDGLLLTVPELGGEVQAFVDGQPPIDTGVWYRPPDGA